MRKNAKTRDPSSAIVETIERKLKAADIARPATAAKPATFVKVFAAVTPSAVKRTCILLIPAPISRAIFPAATLF